MKFLFLLVLILATAAFSFQLYRLIQQMSELKLETAKINQQIMPMEQENQELMADLEYFQKPGRLVNELRKSGYALPDEKMLIIVPDK